MKLALMGLLAFAAGAGVVALGLRRPLPWYREPLTSDSHRRIHKVWQEPGLDTSTGLRTRAPWGRDRQFDVGEAV